MNKFIIFGAKEQKERMLRTKKKREGLDLTVIKLHWPESC
jgi:hypothetical protein